MENLTKKQQTVILTAKGAVSKAVTNALRNCTFVDNKVYHTYTSGRGRFISNHSASATVKAILTASNYKFSEGNDSPRGGKIGDYIKVSKRAMEFLIKVRNS